MIKKLYIVLSRICDLGFDIVVFWLEPSLDGLEAPFARKDQRYRGGKSVDKDIGAQAGEFGARVRGGALNKKDCIAAAG